MVQQAGRERDGSRQASASQRGWRAERGAAVYLGCAAPAMLAGQPVLDALGLWVSAGVNPTALTLGAPNWYQWVLMDGHRADPVRVIVCLLALLVRQATTAILVVGVGHDRGGRGHRGSRQPANAREPLNMSILAGLLLPTLHRAQGRAQAVACLNNVKQLQLAWQMYLDEQEDSIDDAQFLVWPNPDDRWVNLPASRHDRNGILSFADGHVEQWKWRWSKQFRFSPAWKHLRRDRFADIQPRIDGDSVLPACSSEAGNSP